MKAVFAAPRHRVKPRYTSLVKDKRSEDYVSSVYSLCAKAGIPGPIDKQHIVTDKVNRGMTCEWHGNTFKASAVFLDTHCVVSDNIKQQRAVEDKVMKRVKQELFAKIYLHMLETVQQEGEAETEE